MQIPPPPPPKKVAKNIFIVPKDVQCSETFTKNEPDSKTLTSLRVIPDNQLARGGM